MVCLACFEAPIDFQIESSRMLGFTLDESGFPHASDLKVDFNPLSGSVVLIWRLTGFYKRATLALNGLSSPVIVKNS